MPAPDRGAAPCARRYRGPGGVPFAPGSSRTPPAQLEPQGRELLFDLVQRLAAEVLDVDDLVLRPLEQIAEGIDPRALEAVVRPHGEVELLDRHRGELSRLVGLRPPRDLGAGRRAH